MKNETIITFVIILLIPQIVQSIELESRPFLGVMGPRTDSNINGALIERVIPGGTGKALKLESGDLIKSLNSNKISNFSQLVENLNKIKVGNKISVNIVRNNKTITLKGKLKGRPKEHAALGSKYDVIYDAVEIDNNQLRSIVYRPKTINKKLKFPAVFFVQGYTCASIDNGLYPNSTIQQLLGSIANAGYVVYKIEKFGIGDSIGDTKCSEIDFTTELAGFNAGLDALKAYDFVDSNQVHLFGHSLGGVYAPFIAQHSPIKSLVSYGSVVKPWYQYLLDIYSKQSLIFNTPIQQAIDNKETVAPLLKAWLKSDLSWTDIIASKEHQASLASNLVPISGEQVYHRHYTFFRDLNRYDLAKAWEQTNSHVLAIHGSLDIQAIDDNWAIQMASLPKKKGLKTKKVVLKGTEHGFMKYDSMREYLSARNDRSYNPDEPGENYDPKVAETIINWLGDLTNI